MTEATISPARAYAAEPVARRWMTAEKDAVVAIKPCGKAVCGTIDRFLVPPPEGLDQRDINNPDTKLRTRKLLGLAILSGFTADDVGRRYRRLRSHDR